MAHYQILRASCYGCCSGDLLGPGKGRGQDLLHVVDLVMLSLLVASDLALRLLRQLTQILLRVLLHGVLHCLGQCESVLVHPFVQSPVDC